MLNYDSMYGRKVIWLNFNLKLLFEFQSLEKVDIDHKMSIRFLRWRDEDNETKKIRLLFFF